MSNFLRKLERLGLVKDVFTKRLLISKLLLSIMIKTVKQQRLSTRKLKIKFTMLFMACCSRSIITRANAEKAHMELSSWKNAHDGKLIKDDVLVAKNYLDKEELELLNHFVSMYWIMRKIRRKEKFP